MPIVFLVPEELFVGRISKTKSTKRSEGTTGGNAIKTSYLPDVPTAQNTERYWMSDYIEWIGAS